VAHLISGEAHGMCHPSERFREIALVVLCLNDSDLQWLHRFDAEEVDTEAPPDDDLHHQ